MTERRVGISGYGREGQAVHHFLLSDEEASQWVGAVLVSPRVTSAEHIAYALARDTLRGNLPEGRVGVDPYRPDILLIDGRPVRLLVRDLTKGSSEPILWGEDIELVYETSGVVKDAALASQHLGVPRRIIYTCRLDPQRFPEGMKTIVLGVNEREFDPRSDIHISNTSCSTKAAVVPLTVLQERWGEPCMIMADLVHGYTSSQSSLDRAHPKDPRKGRSRDNIIPTSSNAERGIADFFPGVPILVRTTRVNDPFASYMNLEVFFGLNREITEERINDLFREQAEGPRRGIVGFDENKPVSSDFRLDTHAAVVDAVLTRVSHNSEFGFTVVVLGVWYNHEYGSAAQAARLGDYVLNRAV